MQELTHIGRDVHKETIAVAVLRPGASECEERLIANTPAALCELLSRYPDRAALRTCYEAGPTGYDTHLSAVKQSCRSAYDETCRMRARAYGFSSGGHHLLLSARPCGP